MPKMTAPDAAVASMRKRTHAQAEQGKEQQHYEQDDDTAAYNDQEAASSAAAITHLQRKAPKVCTTFELFPGLFLLCCEGGWLLAAGLSSE